MQSPLPDDGPGNISIDPLFVDPDNGDLRLMPGSPCIDAGNNWSVPPDTADLDLDEAVGIADFLILPGNWAKTR